MTTPRARRRGDQHRTRAGSRRALTPKGWRTAANSDRFDLYERSVQDPVAECNFIDQVWKERRRRSPRHIREDFCGTAIASNAWVKRRAGNTAIGVDLDQEVLAWAKARMNRRLKPAQRRRLTLLRADVRDVKTRPVDTVLAMNFSSFIFRTRDAMRAYFQAVHRSLVSDGLFLMDAYGGYESFNELQEEKDMDGFTYVWDQNMVNPITGAVTNHIHFKFPDRSIMRRAFTYHWRLWTLPELQELLREAGFRNALVYWEGTDEKTNEGNGEWAPSTRGEACAGWIAYIVGEK